jgi:hypothetical protein
MCLLSLLTINNNERTYFFWKKIYQTSGNIITKAKWCGEITVDQEIFYCRL